MRCSWLTLVLTSPNGRIHSHCWPTHSYNRKYVRKSGLQWFKSQYYPSMKCVSIYVIGIRTGDHVRHKRNICLVGCCYRITFCSVRLWKYREWNTCVVFYNLSNETSSTSTRSAYAFVDRKRGCLLSQKCYNLYSSFS